MLSERLKLLRNEKDLSQRELANILNISNGTIAMYETNKRQPDNDTLSKIADFFNVSIDYLLGKTDIKKPQNIDEKYSVLLNDEELAEALEELMDLSDNDKKEIIDYIKFKKNKENELNKKI